MKSFFIFRPVTIIAAVLGLIVGVVITLVYEKNFDQHSKFGQEVNKPLYWVAPMDPNYKRDEPGKSPMGMDLVPVYKEDTITKEDEPGVVHIAPNVVNNIGVRTTKVKYDQLKQEVVSAAYVEYDENKLIHIHPRLSGWIEKLYVKSSGAPVEKGQSLYSLYSPELVHAQEEFLVALKHGGSRLVKAAENRLLALKVPSSFINTLKRTKKVKQSITFFSPQDGIVDNLAIREGYFVKPENNLFSIGSIDSVWVRANVFERQAAFVSVGDKVTMTLDYMPGKIWHGKIDYIYPVIDSTTRTLQVRIVFNNPNKRLLPNMYAQVVIHANSEDKALLIPSEALIRTAKQNRVVLSLGEGDFKSIAVKVGRESLDEIEILEGLQEGEEIVSSAQFLLDSESSKSSDFKRIEAKDTKQEQQVKSAWVSATIIAQLPEERRVRVSHEAIDAWEMMAMTMNFDVAESIDYESLKPYTKLHIEIKKNNSGFFEIIDTHIMAQSPQETNLQTAKVSGVIKAIDAEKRSVTIDRGPISKWNRPAATVEFYISRNIKLSEFTLEKEIFFEFEINNQKFILIKLLDNKHEKNLHHHVNNEKSEG